MSAKGTAPPIPLGDIPARLVACYGLAARAALDIGPKAVASSKLHRALEDICQLRDTLAEVMAQLSRIPDLVGGSSACLREDRIINEARIKLLVLEASNGYALNWDYHVKKAKEDEGGQS